MKWIAAACVSFVLAMPLATAQTNRPENGLVPDAETAIAIAVAAWNPVYGPENIARQKPYQASLSNGVWTVTGSLPPNRVGGVARIEISKEDARILRMEHGR
jgi:hypothetical protein